MTPTLYRHLNNIKQAISTAIRDDVNEKQTPADTAQKLIAMDSDTVKWIFAETVKACDWDGRYSRKVKEWAKSLFVPGLSQEDGDRYGRLDGPHPAHINQVIEAMIKA